MKYFDISEFSDSASVLSETALRERGQNSLYLRFGKRVFDLVLAVLLLPMLIPVILGIWLVIRSDGGNGFFAHRRVGQNGKVFRCWKIRTMVMDAEARLRKYLAENPEAALEWKQSHKLTNDPRITRLGHFLRATSLDELPQIWNVLRGDMSFVGPRPVVRAELHKYGAARPVYLALRPGLTGLWQVSGRNDVSYNERVQMDVQYLSMASLKNDIILLVKTGQAVVGQTGK